MNYKIFAAFALIALTGCSAPAVQPTVSPTPSASATLTQEEIDAQFLKIAEDSCNRAWKDGVVEADVSTPDQKLIIIPKEQAYKDFSGAYVDETGVPKVIYEVELSACLPSYLISMQQEANKDNSGDYEHKIEMIDDAHYVWWQRFGGGELTPTNYEVANGYVVKATSKDIDRDIVISYGPVSEADMSLLKQAVDAELASWEDQQ